MDDSAWNPTLRPLYDVGTEPSIVLQGRSKARTSVQSEQPNPSPGESDQERNEPPVSPHEERLHAVGFRRRGGAWRR